MQRDDFCLLIEDTIKEGDTIVSLVFKNNLLVITLIDQDGDKGEIRVKTNKRRR